MSDSTHPVTLETPTVEQNAEVRKQVRLFVKVGLVSILITCATVGFSFLTGGNVVVAMLLAATNAAIIGIFTMHLKWERGTIYRIVFLSLFFTLDLFLVTYLFYANPIHL